MIQVNCVKHKSILNSMGKQTANIKFYKSFFIIIIVTVEALYHIENINITYAIPVFFLTMPHHLVLNIHK